MREREGEPAPREITPEEIEAAIRRGRAMRSAVAHGGLARIGAWARAVAARIAAAMGGRRAPARGGRDPSRCTPAPGAQSRRRRA